jgi:hypothetical protein
LLDLVKVLQVLQFIHASCGNLLARGVVDEGSDSVGVFRLVA